MVVNPQELRNIPLKLGENVYIRDVGTVSDATDIPVGYALVNGRKSIYINPIRIEGILGLDHKEALPLLDELLEHATREQFQYRHEWRQGDLVMWDNRCTMHRGTEFDDTRWPRDLQRVTTSDKIDAFGTFETPSAVSPDY